MGSELKKFYLLLMLFGFVSLFADVTYEVSRGVPPPFLGLLGATATIVGFVLGGAELLGYIIRYPMGRLADKTNRYWFLVSVGYFVNLVSVPLLALVNRLDIAIILVFLERIGKGIRSPSREVLLTNLSSKIPIGRVFGIHEMLDQIGAISGPLLAAIVLYIKGEYHFLFLVLAIPALTSLIFLLITYLKYDIAPMKIEVDQDISSNSASLAKTLIFSVGIAFGVLALIPYSIILYASDKSGFYKIWFVPMIYLIIMGVDGLIAPLLGELYSRFGHRINLLLPISSLASTYFFILQTPESILVSAFLAGISIGITETTTKSTISDISESKSRGTVFGVYYTIIGISNILAGIIYGYLFDTNLLTLSIYISITSTIISTTILFQKTFNRI